MRLRGLLVPAAVLVVFSCTEALAQSQSEIQAAKNLARSYGYSETEIDNFINHSNGSTTVSSAVADAVATEPQNDVTVLTPQRQAPETRRNDPDAIYGHDYFISSGLSMIPSYNAPAPASYVLGPGDEVIVDIWGATVSHVVSTIRNDGSISLAELGPVYLAGMNLNAAEASLKNQLASIYSGLADDKGDTFIRLSVGKIKGVSINVSGEVVTPGVYTLPSLTSIPSAVFMAGGVTETGSVRKISLYRRGKRVAYFDLYDFLFSGKFDERLRLQDGDVINVEPYSSVVAVSGSVMRGMRYELKEGETIDQLIRYAGGFTTDAQRSGVHVSRVGVASNRDFDVEASSFGSFKLQDGDRISVRRYRSTNENSVSITGPVKYPGEYAIDSKITDVASLIKAAGGLIEGAFTGYGQINRLDANRQPEFVTFDLAKVISGSEKILLRREDAVVLYSQNDFIQTQIVTIDGAVANPGAYSYHEGITVDELVELAGGLTPDAYLARGVISHEAVNGHSSIAPFDVAGMLSGNKIVLMRDDAVWIYSIDDVKRPRYISVYGEVNAPDEYPFREGMTIREAVALAMGISDGADLSNVQLSSRGGRERGRVEVLNMEEHPELMDKTISAYDVVSFRRLTYYRDQVTVTVNGEVMSPGIFVVDKPVIRLSDVMERTGGFTKEAYPHGARLTRVLTDEEIERQRIAVAIANKNLDEKTQIDTMALSSSYTIGIDLERAMANPGSVSDVILRKGDILEIPQMNNTVKISGGVFYPNTVSYDKSLSWKDYIHLAGGYTRLARKGKTYAVYMNGKVAVKGDIKPEPGMEIIVPERDRSDVQKMSPLEIASLATSATSVATLVASLIKLF